MNQLYSVNQIFLNKLTGIIEDNLENEQFGVEEVSREMGLTYSKINRKLKSMANQSLAQFIREIRLKRAMEMLQQNEVTASEIAYKVGFGSPTYFNKCFHDYYGFPPGDVKKREISIPNLKKITTHETDPAPKSTKPAFLTSLFIKSKRKGFRLLAFILILIGLLVTILFISSYLFNQSLFKRTNASTLNKSIAVLPFKNLSDNKENQYFADGVMEGVLNNLFRIREFKVISRTSVEQFRESTLSSPQIAEKLGVNYLLEGSVARDTNQVRIFVQLIDARQDQHIWSEEFDRKLTDIFIIQSDIAKQIASELQVVLSAKEIENIEKIPTKNPEAYNLYLKGRFFWKWRTQEGLNTSVTYFEKAIVADPGYALAYAGLADAYFIQAWWGWSSRMEGYDRAKKTALRALELDKNLAEAHATLGDILAWSDWKWEEARKELQLAIELNPNYVTAHHYYSELHDILGENEEARAQINRALELDPFYPILYGLSAIYYCHMGKYEKSLEECRKEEEFDPGYVRVYWNNLFIYLKRGEDLKAFECIQKIMQKDTLTLKYIQPLKVFTKSPD